MRGWLVAALFVTGCLVVAGVSASGTAGGGAEDTTRNALIGATWTLVALWGEGMDPALPAVALRSATTFRLEGDRLALRTADNALAIILVRDSSAPPRSVPGPNSKIRFELDRLDTDGLQGPPDGLRALHYEYCIPDRPEAIRAVIAIDRTLQFQRGPPGRVGCGADELLCLGHTNQPNHRAVLEQLTRLSFVAEIREAFFE